MSQIVASETTATTRNQLSYFEKLQKSNAAGWCRHFRLEPYTNTLAERQQNLSQTNKPLADFLEFAMQKMDRCEPKKPCGVFGCRKCRDKQLFNEVCRVSKIVSKYTTSRRGVAVCIGIGSQAWIGTAEQGMAQLEHDIEAIRDFLDRSSCIESYQLSVDVNINEDGLFHFHLHGTLLYRYSAPEDLGEQLELAVRHQVGVRVWTQPLKGSYKTSGGKADSRICSFKDTVGWVCYASKKGFTKHLSAKQQVDIQTALIGRTLSWQRGRLAKNDSFTIREGRALTELPFELDELQTLADKTSTTNQVANLLAETRQAIQEALLLRRKRLERESKRRLRRKAAFNRLRSMFAVGQPLAKRKDEWEAKSQLRREAQQENIAAQLSRASQLRKNIERLLVKIASTISQAIVGQLTRPYVGSRYLDSLPQNKSPLVSFAISAANVAACCVLANSDLSQKQRSRYGKLVERIADYWPTLSLDQNNNPAWDLFWYKWSLLLKFHV